MIRPQYLLAFGLLAACGDDDGPGKVVDARMPDMREPPDADFGTVPRIENVPCKFVVGSSLGLAEGTGYSCGDLVVEENRGTHEGRIRLHFIRFKSTVTTTNRATIYLDGGPGGDGQNIVDYTAYLGTSFLNGLLVDGDFLVLGQRGTRLSTPFLECGTVDCSEFTGLADLTAYNSAYNADDVDELRSMLGLDKLNLYGISYGSRLGLEVLRRHGDKVRAAVIEGLVPAQTQWPAAIPASFYSALTGLNQACGDAGMCGTTFGNLETKFQTAVDYLNTNPVTITTSQGDVGVDGYTLAYMMFRVMYGRSSYAYLPLIINDMTTGRTDRVNDVIAGWIESDVTSSDVSRGLYYGVVCGELYNPPDPNAPTNMNIGVPQGIIDIFGGSWESLDSVCSTWPKHSMGVAMSQPVTSAVRTFVSSGRLDPITPPGFGTLAQSTLSNSLHVIHANSGHGATLQTPCGTQNLHEFLADPETAHDTSCAAAITTAFVVPGMLVWPKISKAQLRAELGMAPRLPFTRRH